MSELSLKPEVGILPVTFEFQLFIQLRFSLKFVSSSLPVLSSVGAMGYGVLILFLRLELVAVKLLMYSVSVLVIIPYLGIMCSKRVLHSPLAVALTVGTASTQWGRWSVITNKNFHLCTWGSSVKPTWILCNGRRASSDLLELFFSSPSYLLFGKPHIFICLANP